jgi:hypothetical protein
VHRPEDNKIDFERYQRIIQDTLVFSCQPARCSKGVSSLEAE